MADEKKEEKPKDEASQKPPEAPKEAEAEKGLSPAPQEPVAPAADASGKPAAAEKKEAPPVKKAKPEKCAGCSKSMKKKHWYYRDGKFYCTKRCWSVAIKKSQAKPEEAKAAS